MSLKAKFHLHKFIIFDLSSVMNTGAFTDGEKIRAEISDRTIKVFRTGFQLNGFTLKRYSTNLEDVIFLELLYLQHKKMTLKNVKFEIAGIGVFSVDPLDIDMQNITIDMTYVLFGFSFLINCNYPEAQLEGTIYMKDFIAFDTTIGNVHTKLPTFRYSGPGNFTGVNIDYSGAYSLKSSGSITFVINNDNNCAPNDGRNVTYLIDTLKGGIEKNYDQDRVQATALDVSIPSDRKYSLLFNNVEFKDSDTQRFVCLTAQGTGADTAVFSNILIKNYTPSDTVMGGRTLLSITMRNITFENISEMDKIGIYAVHSSGLIIDGLTVRNLTGTDFGQYPLIYCFNQEMSSIVVRGFSIYDSDFKAFPMIIIPFLMISIQFSNVYFSNLSANSEEPLITAGASLFFIINNVTVLNTRSNDLTDSKIALFNIPNVVMSTPYNSSITDVTYTNSSINLLTITGLAGAPVGTKQFVMANMVFQDSYFSADTKILRTDAPVSDNDIIFTLQNLTFRNLEFKTKGDLIYFGHQFQKNSTVTDSSFSNITNGRISIASIDIQNTALPTRISISNSTFDQISLDSISFIEVRQGGRLFISDCNFTNMQTRLTGSVLAGKTHASVTVISNSRFLNNTAYRGGVFHSEDQSVIK